MALLQRREDRCIGWHCLNDAQKFGIIFSLCVVTIVLAIAWMCYLGKAANAHRQRFSTALPGGRRAPRYSGIPPNGAVGQLPVVQQWPGHPPQICYQPVMYRLDSQQPTQAYPFPGIELSHWAPAPAGQMPIAFAALPQSQVPAIPATAAPRQAARTSGQEQESSDSSRRCEDQEYSMGWRQRLNRLFRLPVGRASTIASSERPRRSESRSTRDSSRRRPRVRRSSEPPHHHIPVARVESPARWHSSPPITQQRGAEIDDLGSLDTNVATVHSDDYDLPLRSNAPRQGPQHEPIRSTHIQSGRNSGIESNNLEGIRVEDDSDTFPSVSSMSSEDENPSQPGQHRQRAQTGQAHFRGPGESDLGTQSSASAGNVLSREHARTRWERRNSSTADSEPNARGPETPIVAHRGGGRW